MPATKPVNLTAELYESVKKASERNGKPTVSSFVNDLLNDYGFETDDVKIMVRVPAKISSDPVLVEEFLNEKVQQVLSQMFP